jgi:hypothetical protein
MANFSKKKLSNFHNTNHFYYNNYVKKMGRPGTSKCSRVNKTFNKTLTNFMPSQVGDSEMRKSRGMENYK